MCSFNIYKYCMFHQLLATVLVLTTVGGGGQIFMITGLHNAQFAQSVTISFLNLLFLLLLLFNVC